MNETFLLLVIGIVLTAFLGLLVTTALEIKNDVRSMRADFRDLVCTQRELATEQKILTAELNEQHEQIQELKYRSMPIEQVL